MKSVLLSLLITVSLFANSATYIGDASCVSCHKKESKEWQGSHHDMAMKKPSPQSVVGNFKNAKFSLHGVTSTFFKKGNKYFINTDGADGKLHDYEVVYTFGIYPLQQYLLKFPDGKLQVPDIAWDNRDKKEGGQKWFHIHKDEVIKAGDVLHWTAPSMNWNYMCADCHSTNLKKNYDPHTKKFNTTYDVINVSCESCHGPASEHVTWAKGKKSGANGFAFHINKKNELDTCAKCHSRRAPLDDEFQPGDKFSDHYKNVKLSDAHYFSDGKIKDEVYVYNSFLQSKMYAEGVSCSDCHNPHSLERKGVGEKVCYQCHTPEKYTLTSHTKHKVGSSGSNCIDCHMPSRVYMGVDERNDHSFRVPRPDLSMGSDTPNACNNCHKDEDAAWATTAMKKWYGEIPVGYQNFSHALDALHNNDADAEGLMYKALGSENPAIAKATLASYLGRVPSEKSYKAILQSLESDSIDMRLSAVEALASFPPKYKLPKLFSLLEDESKVIRIEAARQVSTFSTDGLDAKSIQRIDKAIAEYKQTLLFNADRAEVQNELAILYINLKAYQKAEAAYSEAIRISPMLIPTYINFAHFYKIQKNEPMVYMTLQKGLKLHPDNADLHHVLGLYYVRKKEQASGLQALAQAAKLAPENIRYQYVYAVAMAEKDIKKAIRILKDALKKDPQNKDLRSALNYYTQRLEDGRK